MSLAYNEYGQPFIILREQEKKSRLKGIDAHKVGGSHMHYAGVSTS